LLIKILPQIAPVCNGKGEKLHHFGVGYHTPKKFYPTCRDIGLFPRQRAIQNVFHGKQLWNSAFPHAGRCGKSQKPVPLYQTLYHVLDKVEK